MSFNWKKIVKTVAPTIAACACFHGSSRGSARKEQQINELKLKGS